MKRERETRDTKKQRERERDQTRRNEVREIPAVKIESHVEKIRLFFFDTCGEERVSKKINEKKNP